MRTSWNLRRLAFPALSVVLSVGSTTAAPAAVKKTTARKTTKKVAAKMSPTAQGGQDHGCDPKKEACAGSGGSSGGPANGPGSDKWGKWPDPTAKYLTADPLDLSQIEAMSKYRSCAGHDRSGWSFDKVFEANRSMKHYFYPVPAFQGTLDKVKVFAPFDGTVSSIFREADKVDGRPHNGNGITLTPDVDKAVGLQVGHVYFVGDFSVGQRVKAGALIGYAALGDKGNDFDIDLMGPMQPNGEILGSIFDHMTPKVLADFAAVGVTPSNAIISKAERDASPCDFAAAHGRGGADWVTLTH